MKGFATIWLVLNLCSHSQHTLFAYIGETLLNVTLLGNVEDDKKINAPQHSPVGNAEGLMQGLQSLLIGDSSEERAPRHTCLAHEWWARVKGKVILRGLLNLFLSSSSAEMLERQTRLDHAGFGGHDEPLRMCGGMGLDGLETGNYVLWFTYIALTVLWKQRYKGTNRSRTSLCGPNVTTEPHVGHGPGAPTMPGDNQHQRKIQWDS